eukprot:15147801-Alexandrium_andersonii.AAC.1
MSGAVHSPCRAAAGSRCRHAWRVSGVARQVPGQARCSAPVWCGAGMPGACLVGWGAARPS